MLKVEEHARAYGENRAENYPKVLGQADDGVGCPIYVENGDEERERESQQRHDGEDAHCFVLLGREEGIVGLTELVKRFGGAHDVIVHTVIFIRDSAYVWTEILSEELRTARFEITQHLAVRLDTLAQVEQIARTARNTRDHGYLVSGKDVVFDDGEVVLHILDLMLHRAVELLEHVVEHVSRVVAQIALVEQGIDLENLGKFVKRVDGVVVRRDEEILPDDEVNFLLPRLVAVPQRGEVQHQICVGRREFDARLGGGQK